MLRLNVPERIETGRLVLQRLRYEDAEEIFYTYASKPEATTYMSWPTHQSIRDTHTFLRNTIRGWQLGVDYSFGIRLKITHRLIGSIGLVNDDGKVQFGYILSPVQWGQGYATEACGALLDRVKTLPGIKQIGTFVDSENIASIRVLQKCGLRVEARLSRWFRFINQGNEPKDCILFMLEA